MNVVQWRVETFTFLSKNRPTTSWNVCFGPFNVAGLMQMNIVGQSKLHRCFPLCFFTRTKRSRWLLVVVMTYLHIVLSSPKHKDTTRRRPLWTEFFKCQFNLTLAVAAHKKKKTAKQEETTTTTYEDVDQVKRSLFSTRQLLMVVVVDRFVCFVYGSQSL